MLKGNLLMKGIIDWDFFVYKYIEPTKNQSNVVVNVQYPINLKINNVEAVSNEFFKIKIELINKYNYQEKLNVQGNFKLLIPNLNF